MDGLARHCRLFALVGDMDHPPPRNESCLMKKGAAILSVAWNDSKWDKSEMKRLSEYPVPDPFVAPTSAQSYRYSDQATSWKTRLAGAGGTGGICLTLIILAFFRWYVMPAPINSSTPLTIINLERLEAPHEEIREIPDGPEQIQQQKSKTPLPKQASPLLNLTNPPLTTQMPVQQLPSETTVTSESVQETTAPKSIRAPIANKASQNAPVTWQSQLMAHLEKYRRYPAAARARGAQGVVKVTFRMNRAGRILTSQIQRSSGFSTLDRAAIDTLKRAQPLPSIPESMADELELTIDIEFFS